MVQAGRASVTKQKRRELNQGTDSGHSQPRGHLHISSRPSKSSEQSTRSRLIAAPPSS